MLGPIYMPKHNGAIVYTFVDFLVVVLIPTKIDSRKGVLHVSTSYPSQDNFV